MEKKKITYNQIHIGLSVVCILIIVLLIAWGYTSPILTSESDTYVLSCFHEGWSQQIGDTELALDNIQEYVEVEEGESLVFKCTLPEIVDEKAFLFYSINKEVECYVDGVKVQEFMMQEGFEILKTPGSAWNQVDLDSSMSGKTCTLIFTSEIGQYNFLCDIYFLDSLYVDTIRISYCWRNVLSVLGIMIIVMLLLLVSLVEERARRRRYLYAIARCFFVIVLWLLAELNAYDLIFARPVISFMLGEVFKRLIPITLLYIARNSTDQIWHPKIFKSITIVAWMNLFIPLLMQFTLGISFLEMKQMNYFVTIGIYVILLFIILEKASNFEKLRCEEYPSLALPILIVSSGIDGTILYFESVYVPFLGVWTAAGSCIFALVTLVILTYINVCTAREKLEIEQLCRDLENTTLVKQIEAHFIFNVLNTISAYCKTEPEAADKAIKDFSIYLRSYLQLINCKENIPIKEELEFVEKYLEIQQIRLGSKLKFSFATDFLDFEIPPFTVHTIVENAVKHGIFSSEKGGEVTISTKKDGDIVKLLIVDTGVGFDTSSPTKETSIGISNTKRRLEIMRNASIEISSIIGVGTIVMIKIPIEKMGDIDANRSNLWSK
ncbi:MAG: histidine kinase [Lachnospiraceae bacterium]